jgi:hypothetical protein
MTQSPDGNELIIPVNRRVINKASLALTLKLWLTSADNFCISESENKLAKALVINKASVDVTPFQESDVVIDRLYTFAAIDCKFVTPPLAIVSRLITV